MYAEVIVDIALSETDKVFDYLALADTVLGQRVSVPFGSMTKEGFVIGLKDSPSCEPSKVKPIISKLDDFTAITEEMLALMRHFSIENNLRYVDLLRLFIPSRLRGGNIHTIIQEYCRLADGMTDVEILDMISDRAVQQRACISYLFDKYEPRCELNKMFGSSAVKSLVEKGFIDVSEEEKRREPDYSKYKAECPILNADQQNAVNIITKSSKTFVLHGITGSGKTEVYMHSIEDTVKKGKTAIMLVPEISLTPQIFGLFRARFGDKIAILHSGLSHGERYDEWRRLLNGDAVIAVGARSAIFAPLKNIGIIIVDEEHDSSYMSESNPRYDTKLIAEFRAKYNNAPLVLGSATPDIETYYKTETGEYGLIELEHRVNNLLMPEMKIINMSLELKSGNRDILSTELREKIKATIDKGEQAIVFINRRGYASFVMCRDCGYIAKCDDCDISLTYHQEDEQLKCHYCGKRYKMIYECPICHGKHIRQGKVGTEKVVGELQRCFPSARILRMDNDTTTTKGAHQRILESFANGDANILVGTQMIAKGHDFKNVTLVGILDADFSLHLDDYRCSERTYQLITQVAGRAGRTSKGGEVLIQTYTPKHYVYWYAKNYDYKGFYAKEKNSRELTKFPPFTEIVRILITSTSDSKAMDIARSINEEMKTIIQKNREAFAYYKGAKAPIARIQNKFRYQLMMRIKSDAYDNIIKDIYLITEKYKFKDCWVFVERRPQSLI
ncbi:MAG: primosomal protein N' [Clostridia bacterium]